MSIFKDPKDTSKIDIFAPIREKQRNAPKTSKFNGNANHNTDSPNFDHGFIRGNGTVDAQHILNTGGLETFQETRIDLSVPDTRERLGKAQAFIVVNKPGEIDNEDEEKRKKNRSEFFHSFSFEIHKEELVGEYFPEVVELDNKKAEIIAKGYERILSEDDKKNIAALENERLQKSSAVWNKLENKLIKVSDLSPIETNKDVADVAINKVRQEAALRVLGGDSDIVKKKYLTEVSESSSLSPNEINERLTTRLESAAAEKSLKPEEKKELAKVEKAIDNAWKEKHSSESDFSQTTKTRDCTEYTTFSAVSLAKGGIRNHVVAGHVMGEGDDYIGSHNYNIIIEKRNGVDYVEAVFDGTIKNDSYREVKNNVTLAQFQKGETVVTLSSHGEWSTYGTGKYSGGRANTKGHDADLNIMDVENKIVRHDSQLMAKTKIEYTRGQSPEKLTDRIQQMVVQYDIGGTEFDGKVLLSLAKKHSNPRMAAAMEMLKDMPPRKDANPEQLAKYAQVDELLSNKDIPTRDLSKLAVTEQTLMEFEASWPAMNVARDIHRLVNHDLKDPKIFVEVAQKYPWLKEAKALVGGKDEYTQSLIAGNRQVAEFHSRVETIVMDRKLSVQDIKDIEKAVDMAVEKANKPIADSLKATFTEYKSSDVANHGVALAQAQVQQSGARNL